MSPASSLIDPRLLAPQLVIRQATAQQRIMRADLCDAPLIDDDDLMRARHKRQPVTDDDDRAAVRDSAEMLLEDRFALGIERARRLVEDKDRRVVNQRAGNRETPALATRPGPRAFLPRCRITVRQPLDEFVRAGELSGADHLVKRCGRLGHRDVLADRGAKQEILLQDDADLGAQMRELELLQILPVDLDKSGLRLVEAL